MYIFDVWHYSLILLIGGDIYEIKFYGLCISITLSLLHFQGICNTEVFSIEHVNTVKKIILPANLQSKSFQPSMQMRICEGNIHEHYLEEACKIYADVRGTRNLYSSEGYSKGVKAAAKV